MSEEVLEKYVAEALAALDELSIRELEATGEKLSLRRDRLGAFGKVFTDVANEREGGFGQARYHLRDAIEGVDERTAERIKNATAPFWCHVREAAAVLGDD